VSTISWDDARGFLEDGDGSDSKENFKDSKEDSGAGSDSNAKPAQRRDASRDPLLGLDFQRKIERDAAVMGGGGLVVPVQTVPDFLAGVLSTETELPKSSYRLGVKPGRLDLLYPPAITAAIKESLLVFDQQMPGYAGPHALLHAPEARTSSPVRVVRNKNDGQSVTAAGLFPAGEGAGYAGGIVSAAVDGMLAADFVVRQMNEALFLEER